MEYLVRETYLRKIRPFYGETDSIKVLYGVRRSGKTVLLQQIQDELKSSGFDARHILYLDFEDFHNQSLKDKNTLMEKLNSFVQNPEEIYDLFLDEIQEVRGWQKVLEPFWKQGNSDIYISSSNSKLLSSQMAELFAGHCIAFEVLPLSFSEFVQFKSDEEAKDPKEWFQEYLVCGGLPYPIYESLTKDQTFQYLRDSIDAVILKDIVKSNQVRDVGLLERIILYLIENNGRTYSPISIVKQLKNEGRKSNVETIGRYLSWCQEAGLAYKVHYEDVIGKRILNTADKYYLADHGLYQALIGNTMKSVELILKNIVFNELRHRGYRVAAGKTENQEIDFVANGDDQRFYIQICERLDSEETRNRVFGTLLKIPDNFDKYVLSMDTLDFSQMGIKHRNIIEFLLEEDLN